MEGSPRPGRSKTDVKANDRKKKRNGKNEGGELGISLRESAAGKLFRGRRSEEGGKNDRAGSTRARDVDEWRVIGWDGGITRDEFGINLFEYDQYE